MELLPLFGQNKKLNSLSLSPINSYSFRQTPSPKDIQVSGSYIHYVFGMSKSDRNVYIYNASGVQAVVPMKYFVKPKIKTK